MIEEGANKIDRKLESGEVDIAVTLATEHLSSFSSCHFSTQRNVALVHRSHPLAQAESITVADLRDDHFAIFSPDFILHRPDRGRLPRGRFPAENRPAQLPVGLHGRSWSPGNQGGLHPAEAGAWTSTPTPMCAACP